MILKSINESNLNKYNKQAQPISFQSGAGVAQAVNFLKTNEVLGATSVDVGSMVVPRSIIDFGRNGIAGFETVCRELVSVTNHLMIGAFGLFGAHLLNNAYKEFKNFNVDFKKVYADTDTAEHLAKKWKDAKGVKTAFYNNVLSDIEGLKGKTTLIDDVSNQLTKLTSNVDPNAVKSDVYKIPQKACNEIVAKLTKEIGAQTAIKVGNLTTDLELLIKNTYTLSNVFSKTEVKNNIDGFVKLLKKAVPKKALVGVGIASAIGLGAQAVNRYITKKRTGVEGFVGYSELKDSNDKGAKPKKDNSTGFNMLKVGATGVMGVIAAKALKVKNFGQVFKKMQFTSLMPSLNHIKVVYALTIMGRILASSDKNELRETVSRDYLGYLSWLMLGDKVSKIVINNINKLKKNTGITDDKLKLITDNGRIKSAQEIAYIDKGDVALTNGKFILRKTFKNLSKTAQQQIKKLTVANATGFIVSGLSLGLAVPWLNKYVTEKIRAKEKAEPSQNLVRNNQQAPVNTKAVEFQKHAKEIYAAFTK